MKIDDQVTAPVFNIQTYCIHDGPGIRSTVFLKGCPLRCLWCANPESQISAPQLMFYAGKCVGCGRCVPACAKNAISMGIADGKACAIRDISRCNNCGDCTAVCPTGARELVGREMSVREAFERVAQDTIFYKASGGGVTISGGETLAHPRFSANLLAMCREAGIHTAVESCCFAAREVVDDVFAQVDLALLDIKCMDSALHKKYTGYGNEEILKNIRHIYRDLRVSVIVRVPVIPGYNDSIRNISDTAAFVEKELGKDVRIHLLPYHKLGVSKSESLGRTDYLLLEPPSDAEMQRLLMVVRSHGLEGQIGG